MAPLSALVLIGCSVSAPAPSSSTPSVTPEALRYAVVYYPGAATIDVEVMSEGSLEGAWRFKRAAGVVTTVRADQSGSDEKIDVKDGEFVAPPGTERLRWTYDLKLATDDFGHSFQSGAGTGGSWVLRGEAYLARPADLPSSRRVELAFEGGDPLLPWELDADGKVRGEGRDLWSAGFHTFGGRRHRIEHGEHTLEVAILDTAFAVSDERLVAWLDQATRELLTVGQPLPFARAAVTVVPVPGDGGIPFGQVQWSHAPTVAIYVGVSTSAAKLRADWVAIHEFLHMIHPRMKGRQRWFTEGVATYYQEIARVRSGRIREEEAWEHLRGGVGAGRGEAGGRTLRELSGSMHQTHAYRAVYWGGALFALELDVEIRRTSGGERSLDTVLAALREEDSVTTERFGEEVDEQAGQPIYARLSQSHLDEPAFAGAEKLLQRLGISGDSPARASDLRLRQAIVEKP